MATSRFGASDQRSAREVFREVLSDPLPQDMIDGIWQKLLDAGIEVSWKPDTADWSGFDNSVETGGLEDSFTQRYF